MARSRVDKGNSKTRRMFELFFRIYDTKRWTKIEELESGKWGDPRTIRRILSELNAIWSESRHHPLFEIVDSDGNPAKQGELFLKSVINKSLFI